MTAQPSDSKRDGASERSEQASLAAAPTLGRDATTIVAGAVEGPGTRIGDYVLLQQIGEGGFGSVFLAAQEKPVQRRVALKIIKLGMDTRQVIARFEAERQALALMEHPNIARVLDAGATESGRPYFVMELVKGEPITEYCDRHKLSIAARLALFAQVCGAVQHAHQKGVIHRDIKPSNVLVSSQDGSVHAKVIDFGVAKATSARLTERTLFTEHRQIIGTPEYMSPEQAEGSLDIDTRTDVYALGVLLYELLTGQTPFDSRSLRSAAYGEIQRIIREVDPPKPSTRVSQGADTLGSVAASRGLEPRRLGSVVRGELDWIVMKAMEKDRTRRYETANGLAMDIQRYLSGQAVQAAPPSVSYRVEKFVRRNKGLVAAAGAVAAALLIGAVGFAWQASVARGQRDRALVAQAAEAEQRRIADEQRDRALKAEAETAARAAELTEVAEFQSSQLGGLDVALMGVRLRESMLGAAPEGARDGLASELEVVNFTNIALDTLEQNIFGRALEAVDAQFADQPLVKARLLDTTAQTLLTLGLAERARDPQARALEIRRRELGADHPDTLESVSGMGSVLVAMGRADEAEPYHREAFDSRRRVLGEEHPDTLVSQANVAYLQLLRAEYTESEETYRKTLEAATRTLGREHRQTLVAMNGVGYSLVMRGKLAETEPYWREAYETGLRVFGPADPDVVVWTNNMGGLLNEMGQRVEAEAHYREAMEANRRVLGDEHPSTLSCVGNVAQALNGLGRYAESEALYREALSTGIRVLGGGHPGTLRSKIGLASVLRSQGRLAEAEPLLREVLDSRRRIFGDEHPETLDALGSLAHLLGTMNQASESDALYAELLATTRRVYGPEHPQRLITMNNFAVLLIQKDRYAEAEPLLREALDTRRRVFGSEHPETITSISSLGRALHGLGRFDEAEALFREGLDGARRVFGPDHPNTFNAVANLALAMRSRGELEEAEALYQEAVAGYERVLGKDRAQTATVRVGWARTLADMKRFADAEAQFIEAERAMGVAQGVPVGARAKCIESLVLMYEAWNLAEPGQDYGARAEAWRVRLGAAG